MISPLTRIREKFSSNKFFVKDDNSDNENYGILIIIIFKGFK